MAKRAADQGATGDQGKDPRASTASRKPRPIPRSPQPASSCLNGVNVEDVNRLIDATGLPRKSNVSLEFLATKLERTLTDFVLACAVDDVSNTTDCLNWIRKTQNCLTSCLECFDATEDGGDPVDSAGYLLRGPSGYIEVPGTSINPRHDVECALRSMHVLNVRMVAALMAYEASKTGKRPAAKLEFSLFQQLEAIYCEAFGPSWGFSSDQEGRHTGPALRFCEAIGDILDAKKPSSVRGRKQLTAAIARLRKPNRAADRIREGLGGGIRKR